MEDKKVFFAFAGIFLYWPVEIVKKMNEIGDFKVTAGGTIGGPKKYYSILKNELGNLSEELVYTHDLEKKWINKDYSKEDLDFFIALLGHKKLNEIIIADRHIGNGYLTGGSIAYSQFSSVLKKNKIAYLNYTIGMLKFLYGFLEKNKPDMIYSYAVAGSFTLAIAELCEVLNIKFTKLTHSRILNKIVIDTDPRDGMERVKLKYLEPINSLSKTSIEFGESYLKDFRKKQSQPEYQILQNNIYKEKTKLKYQIKLIAKYIKGSLNRSNEHFHTSYLGNIKYEQKVVNGIKKYWKDKPFFKSEELLSQNFFFYPLHVDPEASTMVISPYQTNQFAVLEAVSKSKPIDHIILVKEHLTMIGRRPKGYYEKINALPGVYMIDPVEPSFQFINQSKAVITLTGTAGLEAIFLKKPAIFLGNFIYKFIEEGFICTNDLSRLPEILCNLDAIKPVSDAKLIKLLASIDEVSFSFEGGLIWSGVSKKKVQENPKTVERFAIEFNDLLEG